ncbi:MAG: VOC family protein [Turneriella sp.]
MQPRLHLLTLGTHDLETTAVFYEKLFGIRRSDKSQGDVVFLRLQGLVLSLFPLDELAADAGIKNDCGDFRGFSLAHNAGSVAEVDQLYSAALACGGIAVKKPEEASWGGYSGYVADPSGNLLEIAHNPFFPFNDRGELDI